MTGAFAYLILTSARNRIRTRVARLRNPRYALALTIGLLYVWFTYLRPTRDRPHAGEVLGGGGMMLLPLMTLAYVAWTWLFGSDEQALAFTEAEVTMLFTAPVSRRALVLYRIARAQLPILTTSLIWTLVFRQTRTPAAAITHVVGYWVLLSTLNLNRLGVALVRASGQAHGLRGARRNWIPIAVFLVLVALIAAPLAAAWPLVGQADGLRERLGILSDAMSTGTARWALLPFHLLTAPLAAAPGPDWLAALWPALLVLVGMGVWVVRTDAGFEEAAAEASARQAARLERLRARRGAPVSLVKHAGRTIPLAPTGHPAVALLWKNALWLLRSGQLRGFIAPPLIGFACVALFATRSTAAGVIIATMSGVLALAMLMIGPMSMRNDLRNELQHLAVIRTLPLRGRDVVIAEVASSALPLAATQYLFGLVALAAIAAIGQRQLTPPLAAAAIAGAPLFLLGLNGLVFMIHNGIALLFPGWVRIGGATAGGGIEGLGLGMITLAFVLFALAILLLVPAAALVMVVVVLGARLPLGMFAGGVLAGLLMLVEGALLAGALGRSLDRLEPSQVAG